MVGLADFVEELAGATRHDDDQDACSQALHWLNTNAGLSPKKRWAALSRFDFFARLQR
jgi:hypothetical protein